MNELNKIFGALVVGVGGILLVLSVGGLVLRLLMGLGAVSIINYGLRLMGNNITVQSRASRFMMYRRWW